MSGQFGVTPEALRTHASAVNGVRRSVQQALDAASAVSMPTSAYGVICQFFPPLLDPVEAGGTHALSAGVEALDGTIDGLGGNADTYQRYEDSNDQMFGSAE